MVGITGTVTLNVPNRITGEVYSVYQLIVLKFGPQYGRPFSIATFIE